jgi:hypothetical protein
LPRLWSAGVHSLLQPANSFLVHHHCWEASTPSPSTAQAYRHHR